MRGAPILLFLLMGSSGVRSGFAGTKPVNSRASASRRRSALVRRTAVQQDNVPQATLPLGRREALCRGSVL
eukprot:CAMPEP_0114519694 /NCGR_PEP_ID=MMETSP0109-20121206/19152_1 /TAXON_ID=29199 /ORGANISM="Chlorarachnion reptans, Strain CCCM449" /LENGTH=70 /DNA_ID=CAMNT_0001700475 /DNA_START=85 /DNA_END=293 /DNA_ORIENTATION=+